jgi:hypothetical protein
MPIDERKLKKSLENSEKKSKSSVSKTDSVASESDNDGYEEILETSKENNRLLKKVVRYQRWETLFSFLKVLIIVVPLVLAYLYLTPMLSQVIDRYQSALGTVDELQTTSEGLKGLEDVDIKKQLEELFK